MLRTRRDVRSELKQFLYVWSGLHALFGLGLWHAINFDYDRANAFFWCMALTTPLMLSVAFFSLRAAWSAPAVERPDHASIAGFAASIVFVLVLMPATPAPQVQQYASVVPSTLLTGPIKSCAESRPVPGQWHICRKD